MASTQEPEIQFAQRLASNEKPVRTKAMKKLRKYISVRSGKEEGGFSSDEVLKLWKGLFYCLWMQDKPLLQEELSNQISCLIHSFHNMDGQFLYLESFLQTFKREWTGIDRLRMDKFFQLVRFMFRRVFELLKKKNWDSSVVSRFLELLTTQLLRSGCEAPSGLQFHVLDVFMSELAAVGSAELTADQNLTFIEPFCRTAAKTKDRSLFGAICNSIFSAIIDQAPFAIEDLMKEVKAAGESDSDSGQASEEDEEEKSPTGSKKGQQMNGRKSNKDNDEEEDDDDDDDEEDDDDDDDDEELLHLEDSDSEMPCDEDVGPVLQFDYTALADKLFVFASRSNTPSHNRQRLYKIIKVLRDLSEGVFPQDEYPEDVSTDEDDDYFGSKKRMKRRRRNRKEEEEEEEEEEAPAAKKKKKGKKQEASKADGSDKDSGKDVSEAADVTNGDKKKKKKKKRKKKKAGLVVAAEDEQQSQETSVKASEAESLQQPSVTEQTADGLEQSEEPQLADEHQKNSAAASERKKKKKKKGLKSQTEEAEITTTTSETPAKKKKKEEESQVNAASTDTALCEENGTTDCATPAKRKKKKRNVPPADGEEVSEVEAAAEGERDETAPSLKKKTKKKKAAEAHAGCAATPLEQSEEQVSAETTTPAKKKKKSGKKAAAEDDIKERSETQVDGSADAQLLQSEAAPPSSGNSAKKKKKKKIPVVIEFEADEVAVAVAVAAAVNGLAQEQTNGGSSLDELSTPPTAKKTKKKTKTPPGSDFVTFQSKAAVPTPLFCKTKGGVRTPPSSKKKNQTPKSESKKVTFGLKNNKTAEFRKTDRSLLVSPDGSSRVPFDPQQKPKFGVLKSPPTPLSKVRKIASSAKKAATKPSIVTPKRRASAADFF